MKTPRATERDPRASEADATPPAAAEATRLVPVLPLDVGVVSPQEELGQSLQQRLEQAAPLIYRVTQVGDRELLEHALRLGWAARRPWLACLIDTTCPLLQDASLAYYTWLSQLTRLVALFDAHMTQYRQFRALFRLGFLAVAPVEVEGENLHATLAGVLRQPEAHANPQAGESVSCPACSATLPASAWFCQRCGTFLPRLPVTARGGDV